MESLEACDIQQPMNIQLGNIENGFDVKLATKIDFHIARSVFLDAFSELEIAVGALLATSATCRANDKKPFGQRIEDLKNLAPCPKISKEKCAKLPDKIARVHALLSIRSDIVHSQTEIANIDGIMHAIICNNIMSLQDQPYVRLVNLGHFKAFTGEAKKIANELRQFLNQPSSPPQPKPGAAGGL